MLEHLFPHSLPLYPAAPEAQRADFPKIPAKPAVYLLTGTDPAANPIPAAADPASSQPEHPLLLATVGDLRSALKRRLADNPPDGKTKRIPYGTLCTRLYWQPVHSPFAANVAYAAAVHQLFPSTARALIPWAEYPSWWIAVEKESPFPRFRKTSNLTDPAGAALHYAGPIRDKHAAARLVELLEDLFDLCRYHNLLVLAPKAKACVYKEMGKCPAPCDGSVSLDHYRSQIAAALAFATHPHDNPFRRDLESQMKSAAQNLHFETAARLKQRLVRAAAIDAEPFHYLSSLADTAFLTLQPGQGKPYLEPFLIHNATITPLAPFHKKNLAAAADSLFQTCRDLITIKKTPSLAPPLTPQQSETLALLAHHLFKADADPGLYLRLSTIFKEGPTALVTATQTLFAKKSPPKPLPEQSTDIEPQPFPTHAPYPVPPTPSAPVAND